MKFIEPSVTIVKGIPPLQKIALIARVCTGTQYKAETTPEDALTFCKKLIGMGHTSPFEHARVIEPYSTLTLTHHFKDGKPPYGVADRIASIDGEHYALNVRDYLAQGGTLEEVAGFEEANDYLTVCFKIDIGIARELIRHRSMSFMERSTRWCSWSETNGGIEFITPECCKEDGVFDWLCSDFFKLAENRYFLAINNGVPREMARSILPLATATKLYVTGTHEHWARLLNLRLGKRAHPAMRRVMKMLCELPDFPNEIRGNLTAEELNA